MSGGSFNPARSFVPALISGNLTSLWIYIAALIVGAVLAVFTWRLFRKVD
ncbi:aquaporin [Brumimicrobium glaciale]